MLTQNHFQLPFSILIRNGLLEYECLDYFLKNHSSLRVLVYHWQLSKYMLSTNMQIAYWVVIISNKFSCFPNETGMLSSNEFWFAVMRELTMGWGCSRQGWIWAKAVIERYFDTCVELDPSNSASHTSKCSKCLFPNTALIEANPGWAVDPAPLS